MTTSTLPAPSERNSGWEPHLSDEFWQNLKTLGGKVVERQAEPQIHDHWFHLTGDSKGLDFEAIRLDPETGEFVMTSRDEGGSLRALARALPEELRDPTQWSHL